MNVEIALPEYGSPPLIEVVCGVLFRELATLHAVHLGSLWEKLKPAYEHSKEVPPLAPAIELFGQDYPLNLQFTDVPPLPRTWLLTKNENAIIQVQRDRFLHNWKKANADDDYPRYSHLITLFQQHLKTFEDFLAQYEIGCIKPLQYEITYVNHIPQGDGWTTLDDIGTVFPDFARRTDSPGFLSTPDQINWRTSFPLPGQQGRLHAVIRHVQRVPDNRPMILFELTARGMSSASTREAMWSWFDLAHEWIVKGFTELTDENIRKTVWKQIT